MGTFLSLTAVRASWTFNGSSADRTGLFSTVIRGVQKCSPVFKESVPLIATFVATLLLFERIITAGQSNCCFMNSFVEFQLEHSPEKLVIVLHSFRADDAKLCRMV